MEALEIKCVCDGVKMIQETFYKEHANLYLVSGTARSILIDTGTGIVDTGKIAGKNGGKPLLVANTHGHYDHAGGNAFFSEILAHALEAKSILFPDREATASFLMRKEDFSRLPQGFDASKYEVRPAKNVVPLEGGEVIYLGGQSLTVIHCPGHTPGSICLYDPVRKMLFSGDTIYRGKMFWNMPLFSVADYLQTLKRLLKMDVELCLPGHNELLKKQEFISVTENIIKKAES